MIDYSKRSDSELFSSADGESPNSQAAHWRDIEIRRREYMSGREAVAAQLVAIAEQRDATSAQREAIAEMRWQSKMMLWSVIAAFLAAIVTLISGFLP